MGVRALMVTTEVTLTCISRRALRLMSCVVLSVPCALSSAWVASAQERVAAPIQVAAATSIPEPPTRTRFVIGLEKSVEFQVSSLTNPNRVVVELPDVRMLLPEQGDAPAAGLVRSFRGGLSAPGRSRVVIDVSAPVIVERADIEKDGKSHRLVLEFAPVELQRTSLPAGKDSKLPPPSGLGAGMVQPPVPKPAKKPGSAASTKFFKPVIVIDPGHGGDDSGAAKNGVVEKDAVLAFSKALREKLNARGQYEVLMTRDTDVFVPLDERRAFAEKHNALLFIAVHADYAGSHARGATIYSLRDTTANALRRSAKAEVSQNVLNGGDLKGMLPKTPDDAAPVKAILADLAERDVDRTQERTGVLVGSVREFMGNTASMRENAEREANFRVLMTAKVPSILLELAYVTNSQDAQNLKSQDWRDKVSASIATAIDNYFSNPSARLPM